MRCPGCQAENRAERRFCAECGAPLARACPACGFSNEPAEKFCGGCGAPLAAPPPAGARREPEPPSPQAVTPAHLAERILTSRSALEGERKQVTVLFADLRGSLELLADRDPEDARAVLDPVLERMMEAVHRYEGTVNQVMGDGIMALFGAPLAHEDHAIRACYAALHMQDSVSRYGDQVQRSHGAPVQIRVGLNSGEVVVRSVGSDLRMDYTAVGQTTHLAARMEQIAKPGSILLAADTLRLAEGAVRVKPLGPVTVKGLDTPVDAYELTGAEPARSRLRAAQARGLSRFVGRDPELDQLRRALDRAGQGHGQVVAVVGEPGVGKSRLFHEFLHSHRTRDWLVLETTSFSYGQATSYLPVIDFLKGYFQIEDRDGAQAVREKVTGKVLTLDERLRETVPPILALLGALPEADAFHALGPALRRGRILGALKQLVIRESQRQPLCVVFEDLHWIDSESQGALDVLVESLPTGRVLLLTNYRPQYEDRWTAKTYYTRLRIDPLPPEGAQELLDGLLGDAEPLRALKALLQSRTDGNPLFLEESVRTLVETGTLVGRPGAYRLAHDLGTLEVPATVQALLAARIDRLPTEEKRMLQSAAVIGNEIPLVLLRAIAGRPEDELQRGLAQLLAGEFLYESRLFPDVEYAFRHGLTHDVAYASLLHDRRRALHRLVGEAIEEHYADRRAEFAEALAGHFERGEVRDKAAGYALRAAEKAKDRFAYPSAAEFCERALGLMGRSGAADGPQGKAWVLAGDIASLVGDLEQANRSYDAALARGGDGAERLRITNKRHRPHRVARDGATLAFYEHGSGEPTLLFTNPLLYGLATFQPMLEQLCQEFRIITMDPRGTGASDPLVRPYGLRQHMEDVRAVIQAAGPGPLVGVGVSRGANLLVKLATAYPDLVQKLVLSGMSLSWDRAQAVQAREVLRQEGVEAVVRHWFALVFNESGTESLTEQFVRTRLLLPRDTILSFFDPDPEYEVASLLPAIRVPTLVTRGSEDRVCPAEDAETEVRAIPGASLYTFAGKGHGHLLTATAEFCEVLRGFVRTGAVPGHA